MKKSNPLLSLIVPFYNEEKNIVGRYRQLTRFLKSRSIPYRLIFVNDGSTDDSKENISRAIKKDKNAFLISYIKNKGRGGAISIGFRNAESGLIGYIDSDFEIKPFYISDCLRLLGDFDGVIVSKYLSDSRVKTRRIRQTASKLFNGWARLILGSKITDHQTGLKIFKSDLVDRVLPLVKDKGWFFDVEFLYYAQKKGFTIGEVPITLSYGIGKMETSMIKGFLKSFYYVVKLKLNEKK